MERTKKGVPLWIKLVLIVLTLAYLGGLGTLRTLTSLFTSPPPTPTDSKTAASITNQPVFDANQHSDSAGGTVANRVLEESCPLQVLKSRWRTDGFGTVAVWTITFFNLSSRPVQNIKYRTVYTAETGQQIDAGGVESFGDDIVRKVFQPRKKRTVEINDGFVNQQATGGASQIVGCEFP